MVYTSHYIRRVSISSDVKLREILNACYLHVVPFLFSWHVQNPKYEKCYPILGGICIEEAGAGTGTACPTSLLVLVLVDFNEEFL